MSKKNEVSYTCSFNINFTLNSSVSPDKHGRKNSICKKAPLSSIVFFTERQNGVYEILSVAERFRAQIEGRHTHISTDSHTDTPSRTTCSNSLNIPRNRREIFSWKLPLLLRILENYDFRPRSRVKDGGEEVHLVSVEVVASHAHRVPSLRPSSRFLIMQYRFEEVRLWIL